MHRDRFYTLSASCPDQVGIIARVSSFIARHGGWLLESSFHADALTGRYFMRIEIRADSLPFLLAEFRERFGREVAEPLGMTWQINDSAVKKRVVVLVSKQEHCLYDLLARWQAHEMEIEIPLRNLQSRHLQGVCRVAWHPLSSCAGDCRTTRRRPSPKCCAFSRTCGGDTMVLARYMQILSSELCSALSGRIINIHHSFLPSFAGAKPYHQAYERGVKLIGATCHYVTSELDAGPIIEQDVIRIDHSDSPEDMVRYGKDIEKTVLARGLRYHLEDRVLVHGSKTVVFR